MYFIGLDLGQAADYTAISVIEKNDPQPIPRGYSIGRDGVTRPLYPDPLPVTTFGVRHLERLKLGTPYPEQVAHVADLVGKLRRQGATTLIVDGTGVGRPVVDMFHAAGLGPIPVTITGGDKASVDEDGYHRVPKRDLCGAAQVALGSGTLKVAGSLALASVLQDELRAFEVKVTAAGNDSYSGREGQHDDIVLAVALALWYAERFVPNLHMFGASTGAEDMPETDRGRAVREAREAIQDMQPGRSGEPMFT